MTFQEAMKAAYTNQLCVDFYSNTITDPEGTEWYWTIENGRDIENCVDLIKEIIESLEDGD